MAQLQVIIVGGGLCGLAMAISISLSGHQVTIFEASETAHEFGAGLQTTPNGTRLYERWGLRKVLEPVASAPKLLQIQRFDGRLLGQQENYSQKAFSRYGSPLWALHRVDLQRALTERALELGVKIMYSSRVAHVDPAAAYVKLDDGMRHGADLVVVADGVWSSTRKFVLDCASGPTPTGDMVYRIMVDREEISDPELRAWLSTPRVQIWLGPGSHVVAYSVKGSTKLNLVLVVKDDFADGKARVKGNVEEMRKAFEGWDPILMKMLESVKTVEKWRLMHLPPLQTWRSAEGTCVMAGDCCHAILPYMAQGLNLALEDAATLGCLLAHVSSPEQLPKATALYEGLRRARANRVHEETFVQGEEFHLADGELQRERDENLARSFLGDVEGEEPWTHPKIQQWLWSYDAYEDTERAYRASPF